MYSSADDFDSPFGVRAGENRLFSNMMDRSRSQSPSGTTSPAPPPEDGWQVASGGKKRGKKAKKSNQSSQSTASTSSPDPTPRPQGNGNGVVEASRENVGRTSSNSHPSHEQAEEEALKIAAWRSKYPQQLGIGFNGVSEPERARKLLASWLSLSTDSSGQQTAELNLNGSMFLQISQLSLTREELEVVKGGNTKAISVEALGVQSIDPVLTSLCFLLKALDEEGVLPKQELLVTDSESSTNKNMTTKQALVSSSSNNWTALHYASSRAYAIVVFSIIDYFSRKTLKSEINPSVMLDAVNKADIQGQTPLHLCAKLKPENIPLSATGHDQSYRIANSLMRVGASKKAVDSSGNTPLHSACGSGNEAVGKLLLFSDSLEGSPTDGMGRLSTESAGSDPVSYASITDKSQQTPLMRASINGQVGMAKLLLNLPGNTSSLFNHTDRLGKNCVHSAVIHGREDVLMALLDYVELPQNTDEDFDLTASILVGKNSAQQLGSLKNYRDSSLDIDVEVNAPPGIKGVNSLLPVLLGGDKAGKTPLHYACIHSHLDVLKLLIMRAAENISTTHVGDKQGLDSVLDSFLHAPCTQFGKTPLHYAAEKTSKDLITVLIAVDVDVLRKDKRGRTAKDVARDPSIREMLEEAEQDQLRRVGTRGGIGGVRRSLDRTQNKSSLPPQVRDVLMQIRALLIELQIQLDAAIPPIDVPAINRTFTGSEIALLGAAAGILGYWLFKPSGRRR